MKNQNRRKGFFEKFAQQSQAALAKMVTDDALVTRERLARGLRVAPQFVFDKVRAHRFFNVPD